MKTWIRASQAVPPELNPFLRRLLPNEPDQPRCKACRDCGCPDNKELYRRGWCMQCLSCGCFASGRLGRGPFGQALLGPVFVKGVLEDPACDVLTLELRLECLAQPIGRPSIKQMAGKWASIVHLPDGVARVAEIPVSVIRRIDAQTGWGLLRGR